MDKQTTFEPALEEIVLKDLKRIGCDMTINGNDIVKPSDIFVSQNAKTYVIEPVKDDALLYWTLTPKIDVHFTSYPDFVQIKTKGAVYSIHPRSTKTEAFHREMDKTRIAVQAIYTDK
jgi:hypothetical protein